MENRILIAAAQKSGSTYLAAIIANYLGCPNQFVSDAFKGGEHELSEFRLRALENSSYVSQLHVRCSAGTALRIHKFGLKPILTVRNIFDTIVSLCDHIRKNDWDFPAYGSPVIMAHAPSHLRDADNDILQDFIIDCALPWYFSFFASWTKYSSSLPIVKYEKLISEPVNVVAAALQEIGIPADPIMIAQAVEDAKKTDTRLNVGISGRGEELEGLYGARIRRFEAYFPEVDFSAIFSR